MRLGLLFLTCLIIPTASFANEQYSKQYCEQLESERTYIRKRMNAGYTARERNRLNDKYRELFHLLANHCKTPYNESDNSYYYDAQEQAQPKLQRQPPSYSSSAINYNWSARNRTYTGKKAKAWDKFYNPPTRCRKRNLSNDDFVFCGEDKVLQKDKFEASWSSPDGR